MAIECITTKVPLTNDRGSTIFKCPQCSDFEIARSKHARQTCMKYTCPKCGFVGPN